MLRTTERDEWHVLCGVCEPVSCRGSPTHVASKILEAAKSGERSVDGPQASGPNCTDWSARYPWIVEAARKIPQKRFVLDGEAVVLGVDGVSDFNALHSRKHDDEVQFRAFDIMALDGDDLRKLLLTMRKNNLDRLLARRPEGIFVNPFERGEIGPDLFRAACRMDLEGLVSKRRDRPYQAGRSKLWAKVKNRGHPAMSRVMDQLA